eukprot:3522599-Ditylum_brightwellii.AAC.1
MAVSFLGGVGLSRGGSLGVVVKVAVFPESSGTESGAFSSPLSGDGFVIVSQESDFLELVHAYINVLGVP